MTDGKTEVLISATQASPVRVLPHMSFSVRPDVSLGELSPLLVLSWVTLRFVHRQADDPKGDLLMILDTESWMNIRRFRALHAAGATFAEIGRECGCDWRTVRKYLAEDAASVPPAGAAAGGHAAAVDHPVHPAGGGVVAGRLTIKGTVVHERLVAEHGFTGNYQRVKMFLAEARPRIAAELADADENPLSGLHRRFEVVPGAQAQVDWGDEGDLLGPRRHPDRVLVPHGA